MDDELYDTDIPWREEPAPPRVPGPPDLSTVDELGMVYADVVALETHLASVHADLASYRELVQVGLDRIVALTARLAQQRVVIENLTRQLRQQRGMVDDRTDPGGCTAGP